jgi:transcriptional regulator with XRE-family HTH domain
VNKLKFLRTETGYTIRELADVLNVSNYSLISRYELGKASYIKDEMLKTFCDFFRVEANYFLGLSNEGIICKCDKLDTTIVINEEEYLKLGNDIFFNEIEGRVITKSGYEELERMRTKEFGKDILIVADTAMKNPYAKMILLSLPKLNDEQLNHILGTINLFLKK